MAVIARVVHDAALAYDLATETLAAARWRWESPSAPRDDRFAWLSSSAPRCWRTPLNARRVPSVERRRRTGEPPSHTLTIADQHGIARLADARLELTPPPAKPPIASPAPLCRVGPRVSDRRRAYGRDMLEHPFDFTSSRAPK